MQQENWKIEIVDQDVKQEGGVLILEWTLNQRPDQEWIPFMEHSNAQKSGSATFAFSDPRVSGNKVRIPAEDRDIEAAARYIENSVTYANQQFEARVLSRRRREAEAEREREAAQSARLDEARNRLQRAARLDKA